MVPDPALVEALSTYPPIIIALAVVLGAVYMMLQQNGRERIEMEQSRRDERKERDSLWQLFISDQRKLDRELGQQTAHTFAHALDQVADSTRDGTTATLAVLERISEKVDDALNISTNAIREGNSALAKMAREIEILREAHTEQHDASRTARR